MNSQLIYPRLSTLFRRAAAFFAAVALVEAQNVLGSSRFMENSHFVFHENIAVNVSVGSNDDGHGVEIDAGTRSKPAFVDIDNDADLDLFVGESLGTIKYFENTGSKSNAVFVARTGGNNPFSGVDVGIEAAPAFGDLDGDGDMDALIGFSGFGLFYYKNVGNPTTAIFVLQTGANDPLSAFTAGDGFYIDSFTCPIMTRVNPDGLLDVVVGGHRGYLHYFENTGSITNPVFAARLGPDNPFRDIDLNGRSTPFAVDRNGNGRPEGFILGNTGNGDLLVCSRLSGPLYYQVPLFESAFPIFDLGVDSQPGPTLVDLDSDGTFELVLGGAEGRVDLYRGLVGDYAGWLGLNFNLPADAAIAAAGADPDGDRILNLVEYAFGLLAQSPDPNPFPAPFLNNAGRLTQAIQIRDDDPSLGVLAEFSNDLSFSSVTPIQPVVSDPDIDDGLKTLTFTDPLAAGAASQRFVRFKFSIGP